jgi:hypothetical protein
VLGSDGDGLLPVPVPRWSSVSSIPRGALQFTTFLRPPGASLQIAARSGPEHCVARDNCHSFALVLRTETARQGVRH